MISPKLYKSKEHKIFRFLLFVYLISLIACTNYGFNQDAPELERKAGFLERLDFFVREKPITNREYLIFLTWNIQVYGDSYPLYVTKLFPLELNSDTLSDKENILRRISEPSGSLQSYIFNTNYLDYPVTGLSVYQVTQLYEWMTDRYAENKLIEVGHLNLNLEQRDEDSFSLESLVLGQYQGDVRKGFGRNLAGNFFIPAFRIPISFEKNYVQVRNRNGQNLKVWRKHKMTKNDFLWRWNKDYLKKVATGTALQIDMKLYPLISKDFDLDYANIKQVFHIKDPISFYNHTKYIEEAKGIEKNEFGRMPFNYIGKNTYGRPIIRDKIPLASEEVSDPGYSFYWLAFDKVIENIYWP